MCEGSFLPSSFGPHQKHTEFESSLRSYPINPCKKRKSGAASTEVVKNTATQGGPARPQHASQINNTALDEFGQALHTAADRTSPAHTDANGDPRDWNGIPVTPGQVAAVQEHEAEEANPTPEQVGGAVVAAQQAFKNTFGQAAFQDATTMPTPTLNSTHSLSQELDETVQRVEQ